LKPSRKQVLVVFLAVTAVPAALAGWLAWRLLAQDRIMANERLRDLLDRRADEVVQSVSRALGALAQDSRGIPSGAVEATGAPPAYAAQPRQLPEAPVHVFSTGERTEFRAAHPEDAIGSYRKLTASTQASIRAGAWLRLARTFRKLGKLAESMQAYRQLSRIDDAAAGGAPAPLAGQWAICVMHEEAGRTGELRMEGAALRAMLDAGRYSLSRDTYEAYAEDAARWSGKPRPVVSEALADAALSQPSGAGSGWFRGQFITWVSVDKRTLLLAPDSAARLLPAGAVRNASRRRRRKTKSCAALRTRRCPGPSQWRSPIRPANWRRLPCAAGCSSCFLGW
jgi:hypothetical protein